MDDLYVLARRVLLDALDALGPHQDAVILVGAHAVYLRVGEADVAVAPYTTDGDLALDPAALADSPALEDILRKGGFSPKSKDTVGMWIARRTLPGGATAEVSIDLLVPAAVSPGKGRRAARLPGHDSHVARKVRGLEGVLADSDVMHVGALDESDQRDVEIRVAGPAALLVAKVHKLADRNGTARASDKDALDVLRLLRRTSPEELADRLKRILADADAREVGEEAVGLLGTLFADRAAPGTVMAVTAVGALGDPDEVAAACVTLVADLLRALGR